MPPHRFGNSGSVTRPNSPLWRWVRLAALVATRRHERLGPARPLRGRARRRRPSRETLPGLRATSTRRAKLAASSRRQSRRGRCRRAAARAARLLEPLRVSRKFRETRLLPPAIAAPSPKERALQLRLADRSCDPQATVAAPQDRDW